jgi:microcystin degradation protein MlrC
MSTLLRLVCDTAAPRRDGGEPDFIAESGDEIVAPRGGFGGDVTFTLAEAGEDPWTTGGAGLAPIWRGALRQCPRCGEMLDQD